jgi:PIN domain nuclease of toxin-antitoxin system
MPPGEAITTVSELGLITVDFNMDHAEHSAALRVQTKPIGASIGDRACLALAAHAARTKLTPIVYTAEHVWTKLKWPFKIVLIRPAKIIT